MLNVLKKQELSNIIAIVTRYFGGIKLGAGGLTRAYSQAVADALKEANIVEKHLIDVYDVSLDYSFVSNLIHKYFFFYYFIFPFSFFQWTDSPMNNCFLYNKSLSTNYFVNRLNTYLFYRNIFFFLNSLLRQIRNKFETK